MLRAVLKLLVWLICVVLGLMDDGGAFTPALVAVMLMSLSASALSEWLLPRWQAGLAPMCLAAAALVFPILMCALPLAACDAGLVLGRVGRDAGPGAAYPSDDSGYGRDPHSAFQGFRRCLIWVMYGSWAIVALVLLVSDDTRAPLLRWAVMLLGALAFLCGLAVSSLRGMRLRLVRIEDAHRDALRRAHSDKLEMEAERSRSIHHATLLERTRIAREMHDSVGHLLTRGIMQAHASQFLAQSSDDQTALRGFADLETTIRDAMTMVRESVHDLEDQGNDFNAQIETAAHSLDTHDASLAGAAGGEAAPQVDLENGISDAPAAVTRCFAMTIRESLSNTARHSDAGSVVIVLRDMPALWQLVVQDDGGRADAPRLGSGILRRRTALHGGVDPRGMGLADIEARAQGLGGSALCGPYGNGWRVFVTIPKKPWLPSDAAEGYGDVDDRAVRTDRGGAA
ncbi:MAG: sensor histidine kinase [Bifidobacterium psychraerophilum]